LDFCYKQKTTKRKSWSIGLQLSTILHTPLDRESEAMQDDDKNENQRKRNNGKTAAAATIN